MFRWLSGKFDQIEDQIGVATQTDSRSLSLFRIAFGVFSLLFMSHDYAWLGDVPSLLFAPPKISLAAIYGGFPSSEFLLGIDIGVRVALVTLTLGIWTRGSTFLLLTLLVVGNSFAFSLGKIDHGDIMYITVLLMMGLKDWGRYYSVDSLIRSWSLKQWGASVRLPTAESTDLRWLAVLLAFGFLTAGVPKARKWVDFDLETSGARSWVYDCYLGNGRDQLLASTAFSLDSPLLFELADYSAVLFEIGIVLAIVSRRRWMAWLAIACVFHLINCLIFNISFLPHAIVYLAFLPWIKLLPESWPRWHVALRGAVSGGGLTVLAALIWIRLSSANSSGVFWTYTGFEGKSAAGLLSVCGVFAIAAALLISCAFERNPKSVISREGLNSSDTPTKSMAA